jgi:hypothetical protein
MGMVARKWWKTLVNVEWTRVWVGCLSVWGCASDLSKIYHHIFCKLSHPFDPKMLWLNVVVEEVGLGNWW